MRDAFTTASSVFKETEPFLKDPTIWNAARAFVNVARNYVDDNEIYGDTYFTSMPEWEIAYDQANSSIVVDALNEFADEPIVVKTYDPHAIIRIHDADEFSVGYVYSSKIKQTFSDVYVKGNVDAFRASVTDAIWRKVGAPNVIYRAGDRDPSGKGGAASFGADELHAKHASASASRMAAYLKRYAEAGINRSVMLYGPPGTGKSTMAQAIIAELEYRSLRVRIEDLQYLSNSTCTQLFEILKPDAIILDDFDRCMMQTTMLEMLEMLLRNVKLTVATVNDRSRLDQAILRPGRFDEMINIDTMDEHVVRMLLGDDCQDAFEQVKNWPIAYIQELVKRRTVLARSEADASMAELIERVGRLRREVTLQDMDDPDERFHRLMKTTTAQGEPPQLDPLEDLEE